jgi:hypothetical protein
MIQGYCAEEAVEWALNYAEPSNPIGVSISHHEGGSQEKGPLERRLTPDPHLFSLRSFRRVATDAHCV